MNTLNSAYAWLHTLATPIYGLPVGLTIRRTLWVIPLVSTLHILAIGMIMSSVIMMDLRVWGVSRSPTLAQSAQRFAPWIWSGMVLLTITGIVLVLGAPPRRPSLLDPSFQLKMTLMIVAMVVTIGFQIAIMRNSAAWSAEQGTRLMAGVLAALTLILWIAVTFAGRGRWMVGFFR
jgi:hypothetical protein